MAKAKKLSGDPHPASQLPAGESPISPEVSPAALLPRWRVSLPWVPPMEVEADTEESAIETYKSLMSILSTTHRFQVEKLPG